MFIILLFFQQLEIIQSQKVIFNQRIDQANAKFSLNITFQSLEVIGIQSQCSIEISQSTLDTLRLVGYYGSIIVRTYQLITTTQYLRTIDQILPIQVGNCTINNNFIIELNNIHYQNFDFNYTVSAKILNNNNQILKNDYQITTFSYTQQNIQMSPQSQLTQSSTQLLINYKSFQNVNQQSVLKFIFPYRDEQRLSPTFSYFPQGDLDCKDVLSNLTLKCNFSTNALFVGNLVTQDTPSINMSIRINGFINPQLQSGIKNIQFQFLQYLISGFFVGESNSSINIDNFQRNDNLNAKLYNSSNLILDQSKLYCIIYVEDFIYQWTDIIIQIPILFSDGQIISIEPQNQLSSAQYMISGNQIVLFSPFSQFITFGFVSFIINFQNPSIIGFYDGYLIQFKNNKTGLVYSQNTAQSINLIEQNIVITKVAQSNTINGEQSNTTLGFYLNSTIDEDCQLKITAKNQLQFMNSPLANSINLNCSNFQSNSTVLIANNCFAGMQNQNQSQREIIFKTINPRYNNKIQDFLQLSVYCKGNLHNSNNNNVNLVLQTGKVQLIEMQTSLHLTNSRSNIIQFTLNFTNYLNINDSILISFNVDQFNIENAGSVFQCNINYLSANCTQLDNQMLIYINQLLLGNMMHYLQIRQFITPSQQQQCYDFKIETLKNQFLIDESDNLCVNLQINPSSVSLFDLQLSNTYISQASNYQITIRLPFSVSQGILYLIFPNYFNLSQVTIQQNEIFALMNVFNQILVLKFNDLLIQDATYRFILQNIFNPSDQLYISSLQLQIFNKSNQIMYQDYLNKKIYLTSLYYNNINIIQTSNILAQLNNITISIQSNIIWNQEVYIQLEISKDFFLNESDPIYLNDLKLQYYLNQTEDQYLIKFIPTSQQTLNILQFIVKNPVYNALNYGVQFITSKVDNNTILEQGFQYFDEFICEQNCQLCQNNTCKFCEQGYGLYNGSCFDDCPQNLYKQDTGICEQCQIIDNCLKCDQSLINCAQCSDNFVLKDGQCITEPVKKLNEISQQKYYNIVLIYIYVFQILLAILRKLSRQQFQIISFQTFIKGMLDPMCSMLSFVFYLIDGMYLISFFIGNLLLLRVYQQINSQIYLLQRIKNSNTVLKSQKYFIFRYFMFLAQFYDWKIVFITQSNISDRQYYNLEYNNPIEIIKKQLGLLQREFQYINPLLILVQIITNVLWADQISIFQFEFALYLFISQCFEVFMIMQLQKRCQEYENQQLIKMDEENFMD